jgi:hypothetical protein
VSEVLEAADPVRLPSGMDHGQVTGMSSAEKLPFDLSQHAFG